MINPGADPGPPRTVVIHAGEYIVTPSAIDALRHEEDEEKDQGEG